MTEYKDLIFKPDTSNLRRVDYTIRVSDKEYDEFKKLQENKTFCWEALNEDVESKRALLSWKHPIHLLDFSEGKAVLLTHNGFLVHTELRNVRVIS